MVPARHGLLDFLTTASEMEWDACRILPLSGFWAQSRLFVLPDPALEANWIVASLKLGRLICTMGVLILTLGEKWVDGVLRYGCPYSRFHL
jgi:hypothetical protein